jgi:hypothetical protein
MKRRDHMKEHLKRVHGLWEGYKRRERVKNTSRGCMVYWETLSEYLYLQPNWYTIDLLLSCSHLLVVWWLCKHFAWLFTAVWIQAWSASVVYCYLSSHSECNIFPSALPICRDNGHRYFVKSSQWYIKWRLGNKLYILIIWDHTNVREQSVSQC